MGTTWDLSQVWWDATPRPCQLPKPEGALEQPEEGIPKHRVPQLGDPEQRPCGPGLRAALAGIL